MKVAIVNEIFAHTFFPGPTQSGKHDATLRQFDGGVSAACPEANDEHLFSRMWIREYRIVASPAPAAREPLFEVSARKAAASFKVSNIRRRYSDLIPELSARPSPAEPSAFDEFCEF